MRLSHLHENKLNIPAKVMERYMEGNCLLFAEALSKILNSPIYSVLVGFGGNDITVAHVVVEYRNKYWDISGGHSQSDLIATYGDKGASTVFLEPYSASQWDKYEVDLDKNSKDDEKQGIIPGKHYLEPPEETNKWANLIAQMATIS